MRLRMISQLPCGRTPGTKPVLKEEVRIMAQAIAKVLEALSSILPQQAIDQLTRLLGG